MHNPFLSILGMTVMEKLGLPNPPPDSSGIFRFAIPGFCSQMITDAGLVNVTESNITREIIFDSVEHFWEVKSDVAGPVMDALKNAPPNVIQEVKATVIEKAKKFISRDGKMHSNWEAILVIGKK